MLTENPAKLLCVSRKGNPLLQRNINRDWLHRILEKVGLRKTERWREKDGRRRVKCLEGEGTPWHAMRRFRCTHLETELIPESLIKIWVGHGKKGVTEQSYIKMMGRMDAWIRVENVLKALGSDSVMSPMSPSFDLQPPRKHQKMGMIPGSSMVEHSAVNRELQIQ